MVAENALTPDCKVYDQLIFRYFHDGQLEMCLRILSEMAKRGVIPQVSSVRMTVKLACNLGFAKLATDISRDFERQGVRKLETEIWVDCLTACADEYAVWLNLFTGFY
jgi:pentatricopeptide repeat protein